MTQREYRARLETAIAFLEGRTIQPIDRVVSAMQEASSTDRFEVAVRWREKFEHLEWLLAATSRARTAVDLLTFVYRDPGTYGDDRVYLVRQRRGARGVRGPDDADRDARRSARVVAAELARPEPAAGPLPLESVDEILLLMAWFRAHPDALRHTTPLADWARPVGGARLRRPGQLLGTISALVSPSEDNLAGDCPQIPLIVLPQ